MTYKHSKPTSTVGANGTRYINHPAFGKVSLCQSSGGTALFGEDDGYSGAHFELRIQRAEMLVEDDTGHTRFASHGTSLMSIRLSPSRFAELIASVGKHEGVPCTLDVIAGEMVEGIQEPETELSVAMEAVRGAGRRVAQRMDAVADRIAGLVQKLPQKTQGEVMAAVASLRREVVDGVPYLLTTLSEAADRSLSRARVNLNEAISRYAQDVGHEVLRAAISQQTREEP